MPSETTRRAVIAAALAGGIGGLAVSETARDYLDGFAPLSGRVWETTERSLPETVGNPYGEARLYRDDLGIPHVESEDEEAAYYAVGYVQGFDRIFALDLQRRIMKGELAAVVGDVMGVPDDDVFHTRMDFAAAAEASRDALRGSEVEPLGEAYVEGVNAAVSDQPLPIEFALLDYEPDPWTLADSLLMEKNISWNLTGSFEDLARHRRREQLDAALLEEIDPLFIEHDHTILRDHHDGAIGADLEAEEPTVGSEVTRWLLAHEPPSYFGSNSWIVSGEHTDSGRPILANDPHLLLMAPALWYEQHVSVPGYSVRGFTFPGVPFVIIGANEHGAWGFTNAGADIVDLYTYEFDDTGRYRYGDEHLEVETEEREVVVAGADDRTVSVQKTVHGPLIEEAGERIGVAWPGFSATRTVEAIYGYNTSEGVDDAIEATERFDLPTQSLVYADEEETYYALTGRIPIRRTQDGTVVDGAKIFDGSDREVEWEGYEPFGESTWEGFIPFDEQMQLRHPDTLATANQRIANDPDHYVGYGYTSPERAKRIHDVLDEAVAAGERTDVAFHQTLQLDVRSERAALVVDDIVAAVDDATVGGEVADAAETLADWDLLMERDSAGALVFSRWLEHFLEQLMADHLEGTDLSFTPNAWVALSLPADGEVYRERSRDALLVDALEAAVGTIDEEGWSVYGDYNTTLNTTHPFGGQVPFLNYPHRSADGSPGTVNNFRFDEPGQDFTAGSSLRMIVEPGGEAVAMLPGGNSGDYFSAHYDDQFDDFLDGEYRSFSRDVEGALATTFEGEDR